MNIEELVKKHIARNGAVVEILHDALTEQAEAFKGELQAYDGTVRELTKTVEDMRAAQSVPVGWDTLDIEKLESLGWQIAVCQMCGTHASAIKPTSELATLTEQAETHAIELRAYEATVENLEQRIRQLEAERVPG